MNRLRNILAALVPALLLAAVSARAETVVWSDGFETNAASRWVSSGIWHIGSPTAGPAINSSGYRTHAGANCASTQGYSTSQDARIYCHSYVNGSNTLVVPSAGLYPRLRFWQWFNFYNALGYVEISTNNGGSWTQLSPTYLGTLNTPITGSGVWSSPSFDLSAYAGASVQIAFHFTSGCCSGNSLGWFVDDVEVVTGQPSMNFLESFESGLGDWSVDGGTWEIGRPAGGPGAAHAGTNCAATVLAGTGYGKFVDSRLISPQFQVPASTNAALGFWQWYSLENALAFVEINNGLTNTVSSTNFTITTNVVTSLNTNIYQLFRAANLAYTAPFYWNPTIGAWTNSSGKALGNVNEFGVFYFESGTAPFALVAVPNVDYRATNSPLPQSTSPTNFAAWQGMTWLPLFGGVDAPVGYFGTNYSYTYTTNPVVTFSQSNWLPISQTNISSVYTVVASGGWAHGVLNLGAYAGQTVQIAFHFSSGGVASSAGWFVDDVTLVDAPSLLVPTNQTVYFGQKWTNSLSAINSLEPASRFTFGLAAASTNVVVTPGGLVTWTNLAAPLGTYVVSVKVTDDNMPPFSVTNSFSVTVLPAPPPVLTVSGQTVGVGQTLAVLLSATNVYLPGSVFTFSSPAPSTNYWINSKDGVLTWTNVSAPAGAYTAYVTVADHSAPPLTATNSFTMTVVAPPVLTVPGTQTIHAGQTFTATIYAGNPLLPGGPTFTFSLPAPSTNYWITADGVLTWTNTGVQNNALVWTNSSVAPGTNTLYVEATENASPNLSVSSNFNLVILPPLPPTLTVPPNQNLYAGQTLVVTNYATNSVLPNCAFRFAAAGPTNLDVSTLATNGVLKWAPTTGQATGPYTNVITVTDNSQPPLTATNSFVVTLLSPPPPTLMAPPTQAIYVGQTLAVTNHATNSVLPNSIFTYSVVYGPANLDVSDLPVHGVLKWTPTAAQAPSINNIYLKVADNNTPPLSTIEGFMVLVSPTPSPVLQAAPGQAGTAGGFQFALTTLPDTTWQIDVSTNLTNWRPAFTNQADGSGILWFTDRLATNFPQRYYRAVIP